MAATKTAKKVSPDDRGNQRRGDQDQPGERADERVRSPATEAPFARRIGLRARRRMPARRSRATACPRTRVRHKPPATAGNWKGAPRPKCGSTDRAAAGLPSAVRPQSPLRRSRPHRSGPLRPCSRAAGGAGDLGARTVVERDDESQPRVACRSFDGPLEPLDKFGAECRIVANQLDPHPLLFERLQFPLEIEAHERSKIGDLLLATAPVLRGEGVKSENLDAIVGCRLQRAAHRFRASPMARLRAADRVALPSGRCRP